MIHLKVRILLPLAIILVFHKPVFTSILCTITLNSLIKKTTNYFKQNWEGRHGLMDRASASYPQGAKEPEFESSLGRKKNYGDITHMT